MTDVIKGPPKIFCSISTHFNPLPLRWGHLKLSMTEDVVYCTLMFYLVGVVKGVAYEEVQS